jgi:hypothetical protein
LPLGSPALLRTLADGVVHLPEDGRGVGEEDAAGLAEFDPAPRAVEQARPQLCFELRELMAERGLGDEHLLGRLREAAVLGNGCTKYRNWRSSMVTQWYTFNRDSRYDYLHSMFCRCAVFGSNRAI